MSAVATRHIVGVGDMLVSAEPEAELITYALGSCLGIIVHDPAAGVAGLLHTMLPESSIDPDDGWRQPARYVDTGVPALFRECYRHGARKERMTVKVAGGASAGATPEADHFKIGKRNLVALRRLLWKNGVLIAAEDVGGCQTARTVSVHVATGEVILRLNGTHRSL
ncbi:MAG TPA: chemotaxis protein CheD [Gemmatimonadaceae bacterium]|nr:chemotaxis protein CheD [Gemmatimonadaceae bacterium]